MICPEVAHRQRLVWLDLEKAIREAAEEFQRRELEEEKATPPECVVCRGPVNFTAAGRGSRQWDKLCVRCRAAGYRAKPCKGCGGPSKRADVKCTGSEMQGYCIRCREEMWEVAGVESMRQRAKEAVAARLRQRR